MVVGGGLKRLDVSLGGSGQVLADNNISLGLCVRTKLTTFLGSAFPFDQII